MDDILKRIRDLTIIVGIYLYFIAWIYVHFYYQQFGVSTESVRIDYSSYLMYSYNVLTSSNFLYWIRILILVLVIRMIILITISYLGNRYIHFKELSGFISHNWIVDLVKKLNQKYSLLVLILFLVIIFPLLFKVSREVAINDYREDRLNTKQLKTIQFIFRKDSELLSPTVMLDSTMSKNDVFYSDVSLIKNDPQQLLRLLAESDKYYIVLQQRPYNKEFKALPSGYVYYIDKKDILLSKIILRSL